jgi:hypothetical protein
MGFGLPKTYIFDNYTEKDSTPWIKRLAPDYNLYPYGYRVYVASEGTPEKVSLAIKLLEQVIAILKSLFSPMEVTPEVVEIPSVPQSPTPQERLLKAAESATGKDISPKDKAPDELGCVESLCEVLKLAELPHPTIPDETLSTVKFHKWIGKHPSYKATLDLNPGNIILTVTGTGNGKIKNGHVGVIGKDGIYSNTSKDGIWRKNYTIDTWVAYWRTKGGMPIRVYKPI